MNIKKIFASIIAGASMLALVGTAGAATIEINIHGASAQGDYWVALAPDFIKAQTGCSGATPVTASYSSDSKFKIVSATCGGNTYIIRDAAKASFEGPLALLGDDSYASPDGTVGPGVQGEKCEAGQPGDPGPALRPYYRKAVDESTCTGTSCTALKCVPIHLGVSDVAGESFVQYSFGRILGPATPVSTPEIERSFAGIDTSTLPSVNPFVVPFAFFAHNDVKRCTANSTGNPVAYSNCVSDPVNNTATPISNMTREMAVLLFSGQVAAWDEFGTDFNPIPVVTCFRHAGSGTAAGLDWAVVRGNGWGATLNGFENRPDDLATYIPGAAITYFNDSTNDEMACINTQAGAVGYADADKETSVGAGKTYANSVTLKYQGEKATAEGIQKGRYDYFTNQWSYKSPSLNNTVGTPYGVLNYVNAMLNMSSDPLKIPSSKRPYWSTLGQMNFKKANDASYPAK
jgi:hypothetical protein